jgi:D-sedoheptulose 7-phosphate isomerase
MAGMSSTDVISPSADLVRSRLARAVAIEQQMAEGLCAEQAVEIARAMIVCLRSGGKVIFFGNGGSAQDSGHLAAELMGRFACDRPGLAAISLPDATAAITAIGNDYGYDEVFARQLLAVGRPGDVAVGLTTSGNSVNVVRAIEVAADAGMTTVAVTGSPGGKAADIARISIRIPSADTASVQEASLHLGHTICGMVEAALFTRPFPTPS